MEKIKEALKNQKVLYGLIGVLTLVIIGLVLFFVLGSKTYTVAFDSDGGSAVDVVKVKDGETLVLPANPTKEGFKFNGWLLDGQLFAPSTKITQDIKLKAGWIPEDAETHKVSFNADNGNSPVVLEVVSGEKVARPQDPVKADAKFNGWFLGEVGYDFEQPVAADISLIAQWESTNQAANSKPAIKSCASGYSLSGDKCVKTETVAATASCVSPRKLLNGKCYYPAFDLPADQPCDPGWKLYMTQYCWNQTPYKITQDYTCPSGYMYIRETRRCHKYLGRIVYPRTTCAEGQEYPQSHSGLCFSPDDYKEPSCPIINENHKEIKYYDDSTFCHYYKINRDYYRKCGANDILINNRCFQKDATAPNYACGNGFTLSGDKCTRTSTDSIKFTCPSGYSLKGTNCYK